MNDSHRPISSTVAFHVARSKTDKRPLFAGPQRPSASDDLPYRKNLTPFYRVSQSSQLSLKKSTYISSDFLETVRNILKKSEKNNGPRRNDEGQGLNDEGQGLYVPFIHVLS